MKKILIFIFTLMITFDDVTAVSLKSFAHFDRNNDHGIWLEQNIETHWENWNITFHTEQRWGADYTLFWYSEYELIVDYNLTKKIHDWLCLSQCNTILTNVSFGPTYTQYQTINKSTRDEVKRVWVSRTDIEANITLEWNGWSLNNRVRGEYHNYCASHYKDYGDARYRMILSYSWIFPCVTISPYLQNEFFWRNNTYHKTTPKGLVGGLYQNRFRAGISSNTYSDRFSGAFYWQWLSAKQKPDRHPRWFNSYQYGLVLTLNL